MIKKCVDCGVEFETRAYNSIRCRKCQKQHIYDLNNQWKRKQHEKSIRKCIDCGAEFLTRQRGSQRCLNCQRRHEHDLKIQWKRKQRAEQNKKNSIADYKLKGRIVEIIYDPLDILDGGFQKGAEIQNCQAKIMLQMGNFTPGTIIKDDRNYYRVLGHQLYKIDGSEFET